eukprot:281412-Rhodomonas_salina.1
MVKKNGEKEKKEGRAQHGGKDVAQRRGGGVGPKAKGVEIRRGRNRNTCTHTSRVRPQHDTETGSEGAGKAAE